MKKWASAILFFLPSVALGSGIYNPGSSAGGGGASTLEIGTGTAANYTNQVTSPTSTISLLGSQFADTTSGTTNFIALQVGSVTLQGNSFNIGSQLLQLSGGLVPNANVDTTSVTKQGNAFNTGSQLLQLSGGLVPNANVDGSSITKQGIFLSGNNITLTASGNNKIINEGLISPSTGILSGTLASNIIVSSVGYTTLVSSLPITAVISGSYTNTNLTVDQQGRITSASNGSGGSSGLVSPSTGILAGTLATNVIASSIAVVSVSTAQLSATGATTSNFLRGDNTWASPAGSGDAVLSASQTWTGSNTYNNTKSTQSFGVTPNFSIYPSSVVIAGAGAMTLNNPMTLQVSTGNALIVSDQGNLFYVWPSTGFVSTNSTTTTSSALQNIPNYQWAIGAGETWIFRVSLRMTGVAGGTELAINGPAGATTSGLVFGDTSAVGTFSAASVTALATADSVAFNTTAAAILLTYEGSITSRSTAGNVNIQWKSVTNGNTSTINTGSFFRAERIQ